MEGQSALHSFAVAVFGILAIIRTCVCTLINANFFVLTGGASGTENTNSLYQLTINYAPEAAAEVEDEGDGEEDYENVNGGDETTTEKA